MIVVRTGRIARRPTPRSGRAGRRPAQARRLAHASTTRVSMDAAGVRPARSAGGARSGEGAILTTRVEQPRAARRVWLFDLDDTLHDASHASFGELHVAMADYVAAHLAVDVEEAGRLRERYWLRYGATLLGLIRHHGVRAAHFLAETHRLPGLEDRLRTSAHDRAALGRLPG